MSEMGDLPARSRGELNWLLYKTQEVHFQCFIYDKSGVILNVEIIFTGAKTAQSFVNKYFANFSL